MPAMTNPIPTPGPWRATGVNVRAGDALLAVCTDHSEKLANARLMAAAPDLLRALEGILSIRPLESAGLWDFWLNRGEVERIAREAISNATSYE